MEIINEKYFSENLIWTILFDESSDIKDSHVNEGVGSLKLILNHNRRTPQSIMTFIKGNKGIDFKYFCEPTNENEVEEVWKVEWNRNAFIVPLHTKHFGMEKWLRRAIISSLKYGCTIAMLFPSRTNAAWYHDYVIDDSYCIWIQGKLSFKGYDHQSLNGSGVAIYNEEYISRDTMENLSYSLNTDAVILNDNSKNEVLDKERDSSNQKKKRVKHDSRGGIIFDEKDNVDNVNKR